MPYIEQDYRERLAERPFDVQTAGELNYVFTQLARAYLVHRGPAYQTYNDVIGALEGCKLELYRRLVAPYEDWKINVNGDVF